VGGIRFFHVDVLKEAEVEAAVNFTGISMVELTALQQYSYGGIRGSIINTERRIRQDDRSVYRGVVCGVKHAARVMKEAEERLHRAGGVAGVSAGILL
jgi:hypothetical protein